MWFICGSYVQPDISLVSDGLQHTGVKVRLDCTFNIVKVKVRGFM